MTKAHYYESKFMDWPLRAIIAWPIWKVSSMVRKVAFAIYPELKEYSCA